MPRRTHPLVALGLISILTATSGCDVKRRGAAATTAPSDAPAAAVLPQGNAPVTGPGDAQLRWTAEPAAIPLNGWFAVEVELTPADAGRILAIDAQMPAHRHGMNVRPELSSPGPGRLRAEGLLWHMPGDWELTVAVEWPDGATATVRWLVPCCDG